MYDSLKAIQSKFNEIQEKLGTPEVAGNIKEYTRLMKESNKIKDVVEAFDKYEALMSS